MSVIPICSMCVRIWEDHHAHHVHHVANPTFTRFVISEYPNFAFYFFRTEMVIDAIMTSFNFPNPCHSHVEVTYCDLELPPASGEQLALLHLSEFGDMGDLPGLNA